jgi:DNA-binding NarL/FixJ family response regulator
VDDNEQFLHVASSSLDRAGIEVVGTARNAADAIARARELRPDVILVDISLGAESGFDAVRQLVESVPGSRFAAVLISTRAEEDYGDLIAASPAVGFLPKSRLSPEAIRDLLLAEAS